MPFQHSQILTRLDAGRAGRTHFAESERFLRHAGRRRFPAWIACLVWIALPGAMAVAFLSQWHSGDGLSASIDAAIQSEAAQATLRTFRIFCIRALGELP